MSCWEKKKKKVKCSDEQKINVSVIELVRYFSNWCDIYGVTKVVGGGGGAVTFFFLDLLQIFGGLNLIAPIPNPDLLKSPYVHDDGNIHFYTVLFFAPKQTHCAFVACGSK